MRIGVISDTHDHLDYVGQAFDVLAEQNIDMVCHLGDWVAPFVFDLVDERAKKLGVPVRGVLGNNEGEVFKIVSLAKEGRWNIELEHHTLLFDADGKKVILYHGTDKRLTDALVKSGKYDVVMSGHTHEPKNEVIENVLWLNPGALNGASKERGRLRDGELAVYDSEINEAELLTFPLRQL